MLAVSATFLIVRVFLECGVTVDSDFTPFRNPEDLLKEKP